MAKKNKKPREVVVYSKEVKELLPYPYVVYPDMYGSFIGFSEEVNGDLFLCGCCKSAFETSKLLEDSYKLFPDRVIRSGMSAVKFKDNLCHRCNIIPPTLDYCLPMYGGAFKRSYGWYINQKNLSYGLSNFFQMLDESKTPKELKDMVVELWARYKQREENERLGVNNSEFDKITSKLYRKIGNYVEDEVRKELGVKKIGEAWVNETLMFQIVKNLYPNDEVIHHFRDTWLQGLEIDVYIPNKKLAFEYQGQQHYKAIKIWGGEKALKRNQERDKLKKKLCIDNGVNLIEVKYTEALNSELLIDKINNSHC